MKDIAIQNGWLCGQTSSEIAPVFADLEIRDGTIYSIRQKDYDQFLAETNQKDKLTTRKDIFDACGRMVTLPLVNFHEHFYSRLAKGLPVKGKMTNFREILQKLWWKLDLALDEEMIRASVQRGALEAIQQGVCCIFDHHASPNSSSGSLRLIQQVLQEFKLRGVLCYEVSDRNGPGNARQGLQENKEFIAQLDHPDFRGMLGLHAPFTLSDQTLKEARQLMTDLDTAIHIHLAEDAFEQEFSQEHFNVSPVERLTRAGLLAPNTLLGHAVHLSETEYQQIENLGSAIVLNPDSNLNNAVGLPQYASLPERIPLLPGTDGMHASISHTLKQLFLLARGQGFFFERATAWIRKIYGDMYSTVRKFFLDFPSLQEGERADLVVWDYIPPTPISRENFWGHFIYGILESQAHSVLQKGEFLLRDHRFVQLDEEELQREISRQGERLYRRFVEEG